MHALSVGKDGTGVRIAALSSDRISKPRSCLEHIFIIDSMDVANRSRRSRPDPSHPSRRYEVSIALEEFLNLGLRGWVYLEERRVKQK